MISIWLRSFRLFLVLLLGLLCGCWLTQKESAGDGFQPAELLHSGVYGTRTLQEPSATWITNRTALERVYSALNKRQLPNDDRLPNIDFDTHGVLFLEMGQRPTGGYAIHFNASLSRFLDDKAIIHVFWNTPKDGLVLTQAVTSPFMLLKIRRTELVSLLVVDQDKRPLFELSIN